MAEGGRPRGMSSACMTAMSLAAAAMCRAVSPVGGSTAPVLAPANRLRSIYTRVRVRIPLEILCVTNRGSALRQRRCWRLKTAGGHVMATAIQVANKPHKRSAAFNARQYQPASTRAAAPSANPPRAAACSGIMPLAATALGSAPPVRDCIFLILSCVCGTMSGFSRVLAMQAVLGFRSPRSPHAHPHPPTWPQQRLDQGREFQQHSHVQRQQASKLRVHSWLAG